MTCPHPTVKLSGQQGVQLSQVGEKTFLALPSKLIRCDPKAADHSGLLVAVAKLLLLVSSKKLQVPPAIPPQRAKRPLCTSVPSLLHSQRGRGANVPCHREML